MSDSRGRYGEDSSLSLRQAEAEIARLRADRAALIERSVGVIQNGPDARKWYVLRGDDAYDTADAALDAYRASLSPQPSKLTSEELAEAGITREELDERIAAIGRGEGIPHVEAVARVRERIEQAAPQPAEPTGATPPHGVPLVQTPESLDRFLRAATAEVAAVELEAKLPALQVALGKLEAAKHISAKLLRERVRASSPAEPERETTR